MTPNFQDIDYISSEIVKLKKLSEQMADTFIERVLLLIQEDIKAATEVIENLSAEIVKRKVQVKQIENIFIKQFVLLVKTDLEVAIEIVGSLLKKSSMSSRTHINIILENIYFILEEVAPQRAKAEVDKVIEVENEHNRHYDRGGPYYWTPERAVTDREASAELLRRLSTFKDDEIRKSVASNNNTPPDVLEQLCQDEHSGIRNRAIRNQSLPLQMLEKLSKDKNVEVRAKVAYNKSTPIEMFIALSEDSSIVALGKSNPVYNILRGFCERDDESELRRRLSSSNNDEIREIIASHMRTSSDILEQLSQDKNIKVQISVAKNMNTSANTLERLSWNDNADVRLGIGQNSNTDVEVLKRLAADSSLWPVIALNPNICEDIIRKLSKSEDFEVRSKIAEHIKTSPEIVRELSKDPAPQVRVSVAKNRNTPEDILDMLSKDHGETTSSFAKEERKRVSDFQASLYHRFWDNLHALDLLTGVLFQGTNQHERCVNQGKEIRREVARNRNTSMKTLKSMSNDDEPSIVELVERVLRNREKESN